MAEISRRPPQLGIAAPRRPTTTGPDRCYVRLAVMGDRASWRANGARSTDWLRLLAGAIGAAHDLSWWDVRSAGASLYDVRRVQLRAAVAHRPHLVALAGGLVDVRRREWDREEARAHLVHCARVLSERGAVLLTTGLDAGRPSPLTSVHPARLRSRLRELDGLYAELHERFGTVHLDPTGPEGPGTHPSAAVLSGRFATELARRGLDVAAVPGGL